MGRHGARRRIGLPSLRRSGRACRCRSPDRLEPVHRPFARQRPGQTPQEQHVAARTVDDVEGGPSPWEPSSPDAEAVYALLRTPMRRRRGAPPTHRAASCSCWVCSARSRSASAATVDASNIVHRSSRTPSLVLDARRSSGARPAHAPSGEEVVVKGDLVDANSSCQIAAKRKPRNPSPNERCWGCSRRSKAGDVKAASQPASTDVTTIRSRSDATAWFQPGGRLVGAEPSVLDHAHQASAGVAAAAAGRLVHERRARVIGDGAELELVDAHRDPSLGVGDPDVDAEQSSDEFSRRTAWKRRTSTGCCPTNGLALYLIGTRAGRDRRAR